MHTSLQGDMMKRLFVFSLFISALAAAEPEAINGHTLPPEPDEQLNNSTLLGIDVNNNGVRDDVERWILNKYRDKHPIHIDIAMQAARAYKKVLEMPEKAKEIHGFTSAATSCEAYFTVCIPNEHQLHIKNRINSKLFRKKIIFNTEKRLEAYDLYEKLLSGDSYTIPWCGEKKQLCDFNVSKYEE
jgi:hypothetical protein